jgi:prephenate dehydratase
MKVAIQGKRGAFHHEAAEKMLTKGGESFDLVECSTFHEVFEAVDSGVADYGVTAVENNLYGSINQIYGLMEKYNLWVCGDTTLPINLYLIAAAPVSLEALNANTTEVLSQAPALAESAEWLSEHLPKASRKETGDTATSVEHVVSMGDLHHLAVASRTAAAIYGGHIVAGPINDDPNNATRFFLLKKERK